MVATEVDVARVTALFQSLAVEMGIRELPRIGSMIETPAAALSVPSLKKHVDFFSIGSNDLTQYTMAAGRENPLVTEYFIDDHPAVLRLIELVVKESGDTPVSICGELASRIDAIPMLLRTGIRSLSVAAALVPEVKIAIRGIKIKKKEKIMKLTKSGLELKEVIEKAMKDHVITNSEYEEIMKVASKDGMIDDHEQRLLSQLQELLENGTVDRVKG
jgi:phosphoenolpyruvate-protein kinase (PTS system EI component)